MTKRTGATAADGSSGPSGRLAGAAGRRPPDAAARGARTPDQPAAGEPSSEPPPAEQPSAGQPPAEQPTAQPAATGQPRSEPPPGTPAVPSPAPAARRAGRRVPRIPAAVRSKPPMLIRRVSPVRTDALRKSLDDTEAEANELRATLDALRQVLDAEPPAEQPPPPARRVVGRRRRSLLLAAAALVVVLVTVIALLVSGGHRRDSAGSASSPAATGPAPTGSGTAGSTAAGSTTAGSGSTPAGSASGPAASGSAPSGSAAAGTGGTLAPAVTPLPWPGGAVLVPAGVPSSGPGITAPGSDITVAIDPDRTHLDVFERVSYPAAVPSLRLATPSSGSLTGIFATAHPSVVDLQVEAGGQALSVSADGSGGWTATAPGNGTITSAVLRYRLAGVLLHVTPAPPGRFLILATPLSSTASAAAGLPVTLRISDSRVLGVSCTLLTGLGAVCGTATGSTWTATIPPGGSGIVLIEANLPRG